MQHLAGAAGTGDSKAQFSDQTVKLNPNRGPDGRYTSGGGDQANGLESSENRWEPRTGAAPATSMAPQEVNAPDWAFSPMTERDAAAKQSLATAPRIHELINGEPAYLGAAQIGKITSKGLSRKKCAAIANFSQLISRAEHVESHEDRAADPNNKGIHRLIAHMKLDGETVPVKFTVKEYAIPDINAENTSLKVYSLQTIEVS